jgi:hypothetical protein
MTTRKPCREQHALPTVADSAAEDDVLRISGPCQIFRPQTNSNLTGIRSDELGMSVVSPNSPLNNEVSKANKIYVPGSGSAVRVSGGREGQGGHASTFLSPLSFNAVCQLPWLS